MGGGEGDRVYGSHSLIRIARITSMISLRCYDLEASVYQDLDTKQKTTRERLSVMFYKLLYI